MGQYNKWIVSVILCIYLLFSIPTTYALTVQTRSFSEIVELADTIVVATATGKRSEWDSNGQTIYTYVLLTDLDVIKGDVPSASYEFRMPGGIVGKNAQVYPGAPNLEIGQRYVLFIEGYMQNIFPLVGVYQGLYQVVQNKAGQSYVVRSDQKSKISAKSVQSQPSLEEFVADIRAKLRTTSE